MSNPISFPSTTVNYSLPLLFSGQAQKEFSLNQMVALVDALLHKSVDDSLSSPPTNPDESSVYRVTGDAIDAWVGKENQIAIWLGGAWHFISPKAGMQLFDRQAETLLHYDTAWVSATEPAAASGGTVIDTEARQMLVSIVEALRIYGVFSQNS